MAEDDLSSFLDHRGAAGALRTSIDARELAEVWPKGALETCGRRVQSTCGKLKQSKRISMDPWVKEIHREVCLQMPGVK